MKYNKNSFPVQKLPLSKKTKEWKRACVDSLISRENISSGIGSRKEDMKIAYDLYNSVFDEKDLMYVTDPYKVNEGFPASLQNINIIRPKIDLLLGEETKRPFNYIIIQTNDEAISQVKERTKLLLAKYMQNMLNLGNAHIDEIKESDRPSNTMTLSQIKESINSKYYNPEEKLAQVSLDYLNQKLNLTHEYIKGMKDALIAGIEVYYTGIENGEPVLDRINPLNFTFDYSSDYDFIDQSDWQIYHTEMSPSEIYDKFYNIIDEEDIDKILDYIGGSSVENKPDEVNTVINRTPTFGNINSDEYKDSVLDVWHVVWKSYKKVGFLKTEDENGEVIEDIVDETYEADKDEEIEWDWIIEIWEGFRVATDIYLGIQPVQYQHVSVDNPNAQKMPYTGVIYNNTNTESKSLVDIMKPLQYMYIIVWYRMELALARDKGRVFNMDITQIPKSMGVDIDKWLHYLSSTGINFINPYESGWDIPGRDGGKPSQFNQISSQDLSMSKVIAEYISLMDKIESMVGELTGITRQRQGAISSQELVGNVDRAVVQSAHITEPIYWMHNQAKRRSITSLLDIAKYAWSESDKKKLYHIFNDSTRVYMDITESFLYSDFDVFVTDSTKENRDLESLRSLQLAAVQNGASLNEVATIITTDSMSEIKSKLESIEIRKKQSENLIEEQRNKIEQQRLQFEQQKIAEENRLKEEDSIRKSETDIEVALINSETKKDTEYIKKEDNKKYTDEELNLMKIEAQERAKEMEYRIKERQLEEEKRQNKTNESIKREELSIKRSQANKKQNNK